MIQNPDRLWLFVPMLATVPCPSAFLLCNGLLSVSALSLVIVTFVAQGAKAPISLAFAAVGVLYAAAYTACLYWLAGFLSRKMAAHPILSAWHARELLIAALLFLAMVPVYSFDCMDGHPLRWCNGYELHVGWFGGAGTCGDFHW